MNLHWSEIPKTIPLLILIISLYFLKLFIIMIYRKRNKIKQKDNFIIGVDTIFYILLSILAFLFLLFLLRVNVKSFFTSISIIAAAIAIVSKDYISNAINGMIIMFNNQFTIGDYIQIGEQKGKIVNISLMNLQLINDVDDLIYIPNNIILTTEVVNFTKGQTHYTSIELLADIHKIESVEEVEKYLYEQVILKHPNVLENTFKVRTIYVKNDSISLKAEAKLKSIEGNEERQFRRMLTNAWLRFLRKK